MDEFIDISNINTRLDSIPAYKDKVLYLMERIGYFKNQLQESLSLDEDRLRHLEEVTAQIRKQEQLSMDKGSLPIYINKDDNSPLAQYRRLMFVRKMNPPIIAKLESRLEALKVEFTLNNKTEHSYIKSDHSSSLDKIRNFKLDAEFMAIAEYAKMYGKEDYKGPTRKNADSFLEYYRVNGYTPNSGGGTLVSVFSNVKKWDLAEDNDAPPETNSTRYNKIIRVIDFFKECYPKENGTINYLQNKKKDFYSE